MAKSEYQLKKQKKLQRLQNKKDNEFINSFIEDLKKIIEYADQQKNKSIEIINQLIENNTKKISNSSQLQKEKQRLSEVNDLIKKAFHEIRLQQNQIKS